MTKHEFHIALLLIVLLISGVLGYQFVNGDHGERNCYWTAIFTQTETSDQWHDNPIEILLPVNYDNKTDFNKSILRDKSLFQDFVNNDDQQPESIDDESELNETESAEDP